MHVTPLDTTCLAKRDNIGIVVEQRLCVEGCLEPLGQRKAFPSWAPMVDAGKPCIGVYGTTEAEADAH